MKKVYQVFSVLAVFTIVACSKKSEDASKVTLTAAQDSIIAV